MPSFASCVCIPRPDGPCRSCGGKTFALGRVLFSTHVDENVPFEMLTMWWECLDCQSGVKCSIPITVQSPGVATETQDGFSAEQRRVLIAMINNGGFGASSQSELDELVGRGFMKRRPIPGTQLQRYELTEAGRCWATSLAKAEVGRG